jgi:transposase
MARQYADAQLVGVDLHRHRSVVVRLDADGNRVAVTRVVNADPRALEEAVAAAGPGAPVALEACYGWYWAGVALAAEGHPVTLVHPSGMGSTWERRRVKNDLRDAEELARRLARGDLPQAWAAPPRVRQLRELVRFRHKLVGIRSGCKAQVHAVLAKERVFVPASDLFGIKGRRALAQAPLAPAYRIRVDRLLELIDVLDGQVAGLDRQITTLIAADPGWAEALRRARIVPGIGPVLGAVLIAEIGDVTRFKSAHQLASWAGLTPWHRESDGKARRGRVTKQGNRLVRWAAIEAVQKHNDPNTPMGGVKHRILARRRDSTNIAKVAAARELLECVYYALRDGYVRRLVDVRTGQVAAS